jgi:hypothetical protein
LKLFSGCFKTARADSLSSCKLLRYVANPDLPIARDYYNVDDEVISARRRMLSEALEQLKSALRLLDGSEAPAEIGAHIDLAAHQLELTIAEQLSGPFSNRNERSSPVVG